MDIFINGLQTQRYLFKDLNSKEKDILFQKKAIEGN